VDEFGEQFVNMVARGRGRGVSPATVNAELGQGRMFTVAEAIRAGWRAESAHSTVRSRRPIGLQTQECAP